MKNYIIIIFLTFQYSFCFSYNHSASTVSVFNNSGPPPNSILTAFTVVPIHTSLVKIEWNVQNDAKIDYYKVQRSSDNEDWSTIAKIKRSKEKNIEKRYSASDVEPENGINYYCIKIVYLTGKHIYSPVRIAKIGGTGNSTVTIYSSPHKYHFTSSAESNKFTKIKIYDIDAESIAANKKNNDTFNGDSHFKIDLRHKPVQEVKIEIGSTRGVASKQ